MKTEWDLESAIATYNVDGWSEGYFTLNSSGNVEAKPLKENGGSIDILEVVNEARARNLGFRELEIESDPNAEGFYQRMGAQRVGTSIKDVAGHKRELPVLIYELDYAASAKVGEP